MQFLGHIYNKILIVYLQFKFTWVPYILSDDLTQGSLLGIRRAPHP